MLVNYREVYVRGMEHQKLLNNNDEQSVLWRHCNEKHGSELQNFRINVTGAFPKDAMLRQISEGIRIDKTPAHALINNKTGGNSLRVPNPTFRGSGWLHEAYME